MGDIKHVNKWLPKRLWQRHKKKAGGILRRGRWVFRDPRDQRKHPGGWVNWTGHGGAGGGGGLQWKDHRVCTSSGLPREEKQALRALLVYAQHLSEGRMSRELPRWKILDLEGALDLTNVFKERETFVQVRYNRGGVPVSQWQMAAQVLGPAPVPSPSPRRLTIDRTYRGSRAHWEHLCETQTRDLRLREVDPFA